MTVTNIHLVYNRTLRSVAPTRGFTLIELLIALSIVGILMVMLYGGLNLGVKAWNGIELHSEQTDGLLLARGFLYRALRQARIGYQDVEGVRTLLFVGNQDELECVAPLSGFLNMGGLYLLRFAQVYSGGKRNLIVQRWLVHRDILAGDGHQSIPKWQPLEQSAPSKVPYDAPYGVYGTSLLLPNVGELRFSYFGPLPNTRDADWQDDWKERNELPTLVKISLGAESEWPDLIVAMAGSGVADSVSIGGIGP